MKSEVLETPLAIDLGQAAMDFAAVSSSNLRPDAGV